MKSRKPLKLEERLTRLEKEVGGVSGTILSRQLPFKGDLCWSLMLGQLMERKIEFTGSTIEEVLLRK